MYIYQHVIRACRLLSSQSIMIEIKNGLKPSEKETTLDMNELMTYIYKYK